MILAAILPLKKNQPSNCKTQTHKHLAILNQSKQKEKYTVSISAFVQVLPTAPKYGVTK